MRARDIPRLHTAFHLPGRRPPSPSLAGLCRGSPAATAAACCGTQPAARAVTPPSLWAEGTTKKAQPRLPTVPETEHLKAQRIFTLQLRGWGRVTANLQQGPHPSSGLVTFQTEDEDCGEMHCTRFLIKSCANAFPLFQLDCGRLL